MDSTLREAILDAVFTPLDAPKPAVTPVAVAVASQPEPPVTEAQKEKEAADELARAQIAPPRKPEWHESWIAPDKRPGFCE